ncbi:MAG TPA: hypothetical protein VFE50_21060 [Cyclobacteriaceae bacterium]|nr:hypothetical protein [Cyclobacteriaceae bacterium]
MRTLFYTLSIAVLLVACGPDENTILYNQVMDIHDEVMPKMEELYNKKKELQAKLKEDSTVAGVNEKIAEIDAADKLMMDWMHSFNPPEKGADKDQAKAYLEGELVKVKAVREAILTALK